MAPGAVVRLDRLLARELVWSRSALTSAATGTAPGAASAASLVITPGGAGALRKPARDGTRIRIDPRTHSTPE